MVLFTLAERLHQPLAVIEQMPMTEISEWVAYFHIRDRQAKEAR